MDLWSVTTDFFLKQIKAGQFRITDIMALANQLNVQLKPPRNSNADQIIFLVQDLLDDLKQRRYPPLSMASSMTKMKQHPPLEKLGLEFRDLLMMEMVQDQHKEISRLKQQIIEVSNTTSSAHNHDSIKDLTVLDSPMVNNSSSSSSSRPLEQHPSRHHNNKSGSSRRSASSIRPEAPRTPTVTVTSEPRTILNPEEESSMKEMVRTFNVQLNEQKKSVAKISKLCLGALNAIDQLETRVGNTKDETAKNQPMEKIKKLSEEHVRINALMNQMDHHIGEMGKKMVAKEDLATYFSSSPPNNQQMSMLEKEIQTFKTTNQKSEEELKKIREDMNKFVAKNAQHSHDVAEQLTSLEHSMEDTIDKVKRIKSPISDKIQQLGEAMDILKQDIKILDKNIGQCDELSKIKMSEVVKRMDTLDKKIDDKTSAATAELQQTSSVLQQKMRNDLEHEIKSMKEIQSQSFKNHNGKLMNEINNTFKDVTKSNQIKWDHIENQLSKDRKVLDNYENKIVEIQSVQKDKIEKLKNEMETLIQNSMPTAMMRVEKMENEVKNVMLKLESDMKNTKIVQDNKLKHLEQDKESLEKKLSDVAEKMGHLAPTLQDKLQTDLRSVQDKILQDIYAVNNNTKDHVASVRLELEQKMNSDITASIDYVTKELAHHTKDMDKVMLSIESKCQHKFDKDLKIAFEHISREMAENKKDHDKLIKTLDKNLKHGEQKQNEAMNKVTGELATKIDDLKNDISDSDSKRLAVEKSFRDLNKSFEINKTQLREEIKEKLVNFNDEVINKEFFNTKKDMSEIENNQKVLDHGVKTLDKKLNDQMHFSVKLQLDLKDALEGLSGENKRNLEEIEKKFATNSTTERSVTALIEKKVDLINDDLVQVRHDLNDIVNNVTCHMESYAEKNASLEEEIFKTVRADLKKFELSSREASDEATKQLQSHMNSVQAITDKKLETVGKEVKELNESVTHMTQAQKLLKEETFKDGSELKSNLDEVFSKLSTLSSLTENEQTTMRQELLKHTDNKVNELSKTYAALKCDTDVQIQHVLDDTKNELRNEMHDGQGQLEQTLLELVKSQLSNFQAKFDQVMATVQVDNSNTNIHIDEFAKLQDEVKALSHDTGLENALSLRKIDALDKQQFSVIEKINEEMEDLHKTVKESQLDTKIQIESLNDNLRKCGLPDLDIIKSTQAEHAKKMLKLDQHLLVVHEELAKSIHIIDKHSLEMDDLATRITNIQVSIDKHQDSSHLQQNPDPNRSQVLGNLQSHLNLVQQQISEFKENFNKLANIPNQVEVLKNQFKVLKEESIQMKSITNKSVTPPSPCPRPREKSPGVLRNDIDDLKAAFTESQLGHKRLKKSLENHKKDVEAELNKIKDNVEVSAEQLSEKFSSIESNAQDLNSRMSQIKSNLKIVVAEEIQNSKKNEQFEQKLKNIKELLVSYDMTFKQILESLSMNQMSINDLRDSLTAPATTQAI